MLLKSRFFLCPLAAFWRKNWWQIKKRQKNLMWVSSVIYTNNENYSSKAVAAHLRIKHRGNRGSRLWNSERWGLREKESIG